ncbi:MAG: heparinase II/III family protein [Ignavibacteriales bacterium]|nr:heparinase II/III family protein [Ignavibacteriales bacterium]
MKIIRRIAILLVMFLSASDYAVLYGQVVRPRLLLSAADVRLMRESLGRYAWFDKAYGEAKEAVDRACASPIDVPKPVDAGGYAHERHKQNYREMQSAGILYQVTKDERYARFIRDMLLQYADLYPTLGKHPMAASDEYGRLFWQTLNETVWMVHAAQAYDCIYDWLTIADRGTIESKLLRPMARFLTIEHAATVDRIHNHGTWMVAAVGMLGYALNDTNLVDIALYGTKKDKKAGFLRQMELLFSPDGYYAEGAYYVRYAIQPFIILAQAIENNQPELKVFEFRNQILKKAIVAELQLTDANGRFIPINDALKEMSVLSQETILALDVAFLRYGDRGGWLAMAQKQGKVSLDASGLAVARALQNQGTPTTFASRSVEYIDGPLGDEGGIGILRSGPPDDQSMLVMKYGAQGFGHGHFDKLGFLYYDRGREIVQDYGAVRFVNVEPKFGGRYLPETESWSKQTIAHNTVTVDGTSHYGGVYRVAQEHHADRHFFSAANPAIQVMSGKIDGAYRGVSMQRTMAMICDSALPKPVILDLFRIDSKQKHQYDLPLYYMGQFIHTNVAYRAFDSARTRLGLSNGYQHLWKEAEGRAAGSVAFTWLQGDRYYSMISAADTSTFVMFTRIGAGDPNFNLRSEPGIVLRRNAASTVFATVLEPHGYFEPVNEISLKATGRVKEINVLVSTAEATVVEINGTGSLHWLFAVVNGEASTEASHSITVGGKTISWKGNYSLWKH